MSTKYKYDGLTTYCYHLLEPLDDQNPSNDKDTLALQDSGSRCPIQIKVELAPTYKKTETVDIRYTAVLDTSNMNPAFEFTGSILKAEVPSYAVASSRTESKGKEYDIPIANIVICDWGKCDLFDMGTEGNGNIYTSDNNPNDFGVNKQVTLGSQQIIVPKDGKYTGFARIAINLAGNQRLDFVTFFPVQVGEPAGVDPNGIITNGETTYCWTSKASVFDNSVASGSILTTRTGDNCPGVMSMKVSKKEVEINEEFSIEYTFQPNIKEDTSNMIASISATDTVKEPGSSSYYVVPTSVVATCPAGSGEKCSTYSSLDSSTTEVKDFGGRNFTNGNTNYLATQSFNESGEYRIISRVVMQTTEGGRIDFAVYNTVTVNEPGKTAGTTFLYVGLAIGAVILLLGLAFCIFKKRKVKEELKSMPFNHPNFDRPSNPTNGSSNFLTYKSPHHGAGGVGGYSNSAMRSNANSISSGGQYYQQHQGYGYNSNSPSTSLNEDYYSHNQVPNSAAEMVQRNDSFSLDPYARDSFNEMGTNRTFDDSHRTFESERKYDIYNNETSTRSRDSPSFAMSDLDSEWEYTSQTNTNSGHRGPPSNGTTYSAYNDLTRSTYRANTEGFVVFEEHPGQVGQGAGGVGSRPTNGPPRDKASSEWTVGSPPVGM